MEPEREQISPEIVRAIIAQATARGLSVNEYLAQIIGYSNGTRAANSESLSELMADMEALSEGTEHLPPSTMTYTREDIYFDHD
jgi:hypothetical protein